MTSITVPADAPHAARLSVAFYPRWWFDFAREVARFGSLLGAYVALLADRSR
jgi:hypothetical protein